MTYLAFYFGVETFRLTVIFIQGMTLRIFLQRLTEYFSTADKIFLNSSTLKIFLHGLILRMFLHRLTLRIFLHMLTPRLFLNRFTLSIIFLHSIHLLLFITRKYTTVNPKIHLRHLRHNTFKLFSSLFKIFLHRK